MVKLTQFKDIVVSLKDGLRVIKLNRPKKYNAINMQMYDDVVAALREAADDENTKITALTGAGKYYCSGNDLSNFGERMEGDLEVELAKAASNLERFVDAFISFPKLLVAVVNGPAIGIAVTTLALCDAAFASNTATFNTPFITLGQGPEACSSFTFPRIMGHSLASEVLLMNRTLSANEALSCGLVSRVSSDLDADVWPMLQKMAANINPLALGHAKRMIRSWDVSAMRKVNAAECARLQERWGSTDCLESVMAFLTRKSKM